MEYVTWTIFVWAVALITSFIFSIIGLVKYRLDRNIKAIDDYKEEFDERLCKINEKLNNNVEKTEQEVECRKQDQHKIDLNILAIQKDIEFIKATQVETVAMLKKIKIK
ncbi:MAG: hypothetical protein PHY71_04770 [Bacteroidaceae bacterium]|nr:hypothetical protein [Bacteroidaceae bacterium]